MLRWVWGAPGCRGCRGRMVPGSSLHPKHHSFRLRPVNPPPIPSHQTPRAHCWMRPHGDGDVATARSHLGGVPLLGDIPIGARFQQGKLHFSPKTHRAITSCIPPEHSTVLVSPAEKSERKSHFSNPFLFPPNPIFSAVLLFFFLLFFPQHTQQPKEPFGEGREG